MATIQVRIPDEDKKAVEEILSSLGMDMTTAVRVFFKKVQVENGLPFEVKHSKLTVNGFTSEFEKEVLQAEKEEDGTEAFDNFEDLIEDLNS